MNSLRQELVARAKLAERAERYEDMAASMREVVVTGVELSSDEQDKLVKAYLRTAKDRVNSWRLVKENEQALNVPPSPSQTEIRKEMLQAIGNEVKDVCKDFLEIVNNHLLQREQSEENKLSLLRRKCEFLSFVLVVDEVQNDSPEFLTCRELFANTYASMQATLQPLSSLRLKHVISYATLLEQFGDKTAAASMLQEAYVAGLRQVHQSLTMPGTGHIHGLLCTISEMADKWKLS